MKKIKIFMAIFLCSASCCFAASVPSWVKNPDLEFPTSTYIRALGEGNSAKAAQKDAIAGISLYFDTKTDILTLALKEASQVLTEDGTNYSSSEAYAQIAGISSEAEFFCVEFTNSYYDKKQKTHYVLAYIDKQSASKIYTSRINALMQAINGYRQYAQTEAEPFFSIGALAKAISLSRLAKAYIQNQTTIIPSDSEKYASALATIEKLQLELTNYKGKMNFSIFAVQGDDKYTSLYNTISSVLEQNGFVYSLSDAEYKVFVEIIFSEENYSAGPFVRPTLKIAITNSNGDGVYTYSKAYPKTGADTMETAYTRALYKVQKDVEENFLKEFRL